MNIKKGEIIQHVLCVVVIILVNTLFFLPQFSGKLINQSDMTQAAGAAQSCMSTISLMMMLLL